MTDMEFEGRTERDAVLSASKELNIAEDKIDYSVIDEGSQGLFGIGARAARIRVKNAPAPAEAAPAQTEAAPAQEPVAEADNRGGDEEEDTRSNRVGPAPEKAAKALEVAQALVEKMGLAAKVSVRDEDREIVVVIEEAEGSEDVAKFLGGSRPPAIPSLQFLLNKVVNRFPEDRKHIVLSTPSIEKGQRGSRRFNEPRQPRPRVEGAAPQPLEEIDPELAALGRLLGERAKTLKKVISVQLMSPGDRRAIHQTLRDVDGVETASEGDGIYRQMYVVPKSARPQGVPNHARGGQPQGPRDGQPKEGAREGGPRENGAREGGAREGGPREGGPREGREGGSREGGGHGRRRRRRRGGGGGGGGGGRPQETPPPSGAPE